MSDPTEFARRAMVQDQQASGPTPRELLEKAYGRVWDTRELTEEFEVIGFLAPFVCVRRKSDGIGQSHVRKTRVAHAGNGRLFQHHACVAANNRERPEAAFGLTLKCDFKLLLCVRGAQQALQFPRVGRRRNRHRMPEYRPALLSGQTTHETIQRLLRVVQRRVASAANAIGEAEFANGALRRVEIKRQNFRLGRPARARDAQLRNQLFAIARIERKGQASFGSESRIHIFRRSTRRASPHADLPRRSNDIQERRRSL